MIQSPELTEEALADLERGISGCRFDDPHQREFLVKVTKGDVQAAPGNGKTTLIVAKLALLSRQWAHRKHGICVISHTNAARIEIEKRLTSHPMASAFLRYPHFVGTVTSFLDRFLAIPYLRGLGWPIQRIDDAIFEAAALGRYSAKATLRGMARARNGAGRYKVESWVRNLELNPSFVAETGVPPSRLQIKARRGQSGPHTDSGRELEELKAELTLSGLFRFADMTAIATQVASKFPHIVERLRARFPLVLLDEAQDTNGGQLALLKSLFDCAAVAFQKMGDQNQTLYEDDDLGPDDYWKAEEGVIPLNPTRRFGVEIAAFASRLTVRSPQQIEAQLKVNRRVLTLFDQRTIGGVLSSYANKIREHWSDKHKNCEHWAVASRHRRPEGTGGNWPKSLVDYYPAYQPGVERNRPETMCAALRQSSVLLENGSSTAQIMDLVSVAITEMLWHLGLRNSANKRITKRNLWSFLTARRANLPLQIRRLIRDFVLFGEAGWNEQRWNEFCEKLVSTLGVAPPFPQAAINYSVFNPVTGNSTETRRSKVQFSQGDINIKLGSIHSVKGKTVDSILVLETEVWKKSKRAMDLATVVPHAFATENKTFADDPVILAAATNIFVAVTRPRELLCLAMRKAAVSEEVINAARDGGWEIIDLTQLPQSTA